MQKIHISKTGTHTSAQGTTLEFSELMLQASAEAYDPDLHEAPSSATREEMVRPTVYVALRTPPMPYRLLKLAEVHG